MNIDQPGRGLSLPFIKRKLDPSAVPTHEKRLPGFEWLPNRIRNHFVAMVGEFVGTFLFLFFAFSATQVANAATSDAGSGGDGSLTQAPNTSALLYISLAFGFSLAVNAWVFFRITGGLFNPAVTFGMCLIGAVKWLRGGLILISQLLGSMAASGVVSALFPGPMNVSTTLGGGTSIVRGLFIEMFLTAMLVFTIFMLAAEKHKGTFIAPIGIGLALFIAELTGVYFTGGSLNPARSFGPCVVLHIFPGYHWIYWLGPLLGAVVAVGFYKLIKTLEYETANPGQDFNDKEAEVFNVDEDTAATAQDVARPNVAIGRSEYIADEDGIHRSEDVRRAAGRAPKPPANYGNELAVAEPPGLPNPYVSRGGRYDGTDAEKREHRRSSSGTHAEEVQNDDMYLRTEVYKSSSDAERGELGGKYRVSGL
ncbi:hypothetical protein AAFC00_005693 [Neodothiora populina]|uniref:Aquaporin n=1 Tax=Neodothiora populina TaxID=2781224 RepID=A0ABR3P5I4_9PEZI